MGDISKMYHRVLIPERDQHVHCFLWRNFNTQRMPDVYVKTVLTFGDKPAPAMAQIALRKKEEKRDEYPEAAETLTKNSYMDDIFDSVDIVRQAKKLTHDIDKVLEMYLQPKITKRRILSQVARIYDPIGFAASFIIRATFGMQELWQLSLKWDDELPCNVQQKWIQLFTKMKEVDGIGFTRCMVPPETDKLPSLCVFADASQEAFGACAYIRQKTEQNTYEVTFVAAKSRVAPLKQLTIPRLELQAAVLASRLAKSILDESRIQFESVKFLTDSIITVCLVEGRGDSKQVRSKSMKTHTQ
ncbi:uncharacterized protein LOC141887235 [Acropora palmata]|uniref:uncharacterized protein LOC141887235 n=1 Tax=Acropora palmata TaxID=6131 RepID=UPI003DA00975